MDKEKLKEILELHQKWIQGEDGGVRADLRRADLSYADLRYTNLWCANLYGADLREVDLRRAILSHADLREADLRGANLINADLSYTNLINADLCRANLRCADLRYANLRGANLRGADLRGANLDYSCLPLWCGSLSANFDDKQIIQIAYHMVKAGLQSENTNDETKRELSKLIDFANKFHRVDECGKIELFDADRIEIAKN